MKQQDSNQNQTTSPENARILIVDDEAQNLQLVGEILRREDMPFIFALNGQEALEAAREQHPSLILLDIMMPGMDGFEVCRALKADKATEGIPIIFLTASSEVTDIVSGFTAGGIDYIKKPFIREELLARVHTHLNLTGAQKQLKKLYSYKSDLLTSLAHDIKNPAGGIQGLALLMKDDIHSDEDNSAEEFCTMLDLVYESALNMTDLVDGILQDAKNESGMPERFTEMPVHVGSVIAHLAKLNKVHAQKKSIQIKYESSYEPSVGISRRILTEIFDNVISNAVKYSPPGSTITIHLLRSEHFKDGLHFEVIDAAEPIPANMRQKLFTQFSRGKQPKHNGESSHGVGLAIVKRLVGMYDGLIEIRERPDKQGNVFSVQIPIQKQA